ncbi:MAG: T9SS C-terminal target domain-containing protein, partial [Bacteroidetes bacterium]
INWTTRTSTSDIDWKGLGYANGRFVAVAYSQAGIMTSDLVAPEINIQGNGTSIMKGNNGISVTDHTNFVTVSIGNSFARIYTIQNTGTATLNITSIVSSGTNAAKFVVGTAPTTITAGSSATFTVTYTPTTIGTDNAIITINNNDCDEASYDFAVQGIGVAPVPTAVFVSSTGSDSNNGLTAGASKLTVANAVTTVNEGGTVNIAMGNYAEIVSINKNVTFATTGTVFVGNITMSGAGKTLTLSNELQVGSVSLPAGTIASNGNLTLVSNAMGTGVIDDFTTGFTGNITGNINVQRYVANANAGYRYFGSPVTGANSAQFGFNTFAYNESILTTNMNLGWQFYAGTLTPFAGYNVFQSVGGNLTYTLTGTANTGTYNTNITRQTPNGTANGSAGFNAIGNPYPSPISWTALLGLNTGVTTGTAWIFKTTGINTGQWASLNSSGVSTTGATNMIASSQGFLVRKATAGTSTFTINNSVRSNVLTNNGNYLRTLPQSLVRLQLSNGEFADETVLYAEAQATEKIDIGLDTEKMVGENDKPYLALSNNDQDLSILALNTLQEGTQIPVKVRANGVFTFELTEKNSLTHAIYLLDKKLNTIHNLEKPYTFNGVGTENNRFVLVIGNVETQTETTQNSNEIKIWANAQTLFVNFEEAKTAQNANLSIIDLQGKSIFTNNTLTQKNTLNVNAPKGIYVVKVQSENGVTTKKVIFE